MTVLYLQAFEGFDEVINRVVGFGAVCVVQVPAIRLDIDVGE